MGYSFAHLFIISRVYTLGQKTVSADTLGQKYIVVLKDVFNGALPIDGKAFLESRG